MNRKFATGCRSRQTCQDLSALLSAAPSSGIRWLPGELRRLTREQAVAEIAARYREFVDMFEKQRARSARSLSNRIAVDQRPFMEELTCN